MSDTVIRQILDLARWAPSGDNTQNYRFEIVDGENVVVHGFDTRDHCVYDLDGRPSQISIGAMLETAVIAASAHGLKVECVRREGVPERTPTFDLRFVPDATVARDPLVDQITRRTVQRRPMRVRPLTPQEKSALQGCVSEAYEVRWFERFSERRRMARLMFDNAKLRLTIKEAYEVHRAVIEWNARYSKDRVPDQALGVDRLTARMMRWVMADWSRVQFFNRYFAGTLMPRVQMDWLPGLLCAAHFVLVARRPLRGMDDHVAAGRAVQRFWLTAGALGLFIQPEITPLVFSRYVRNGVRFSREPHAQGMAEALERRFDALAGPSDARAAVFMGRIGAGQAPTSRSVRKDLDQLLVTSEPGASSSLV